MSVITSGAFDKVPKNMRIPGFYAEVDGSLAGNGSHIEPVLIVGQKFVTGTQAAGVATLVPGSDGSAAIGLFGQGSSLAEMIREFRVGNQSSVVYAIAVDDAVGSQKAKIVRTFAGTATSAGVFVLYLGGGSLDRLARISVSVGDTHETIATGLAAAINAKSNLPVSSSAVAGKLTIEYKHGGLIGNDYRLEINRRGDFEGERSPAGISISETDDGYFSGGLLNPDVTPVISAMGDDLYDHICLPWTDDATLDAFKIEADRRWDPKVALWSLFYAARKGTPSELLSFGGNRNNPYLSCIEASAVSSPAYLRSARYCATASQALENHPARPLHTLRLVGDEAPAKEDALDFPDRQALLFGGISTTLAGADGTVQIQRAITTYQKNAFGQSDTAFLDLTTPAQVRAINRELSFLIYQNYIVRRAILVNDGTPIAPGTPYATPGKIKALLIAHYDKLMLKGLVENKEAFIRGLIVSRDVDDPNRINVRYTPDLSNGLMVFAAKVEFSLQWDELLALAA